MAVKIAEGFGNDNIQGTSGSDLIFATTLGIGDTIINTGTGDFDVVIGNNTQITGNGIGILASNISGEDSDHLTVVGNGISVGMVLTTISGGAGGDNIRARGSSIGVSGVDIDGGGGNDTFDLQNGSGNVDGGSGNDTLILDGAMSEYNFLTETGPNPNQSGNILGNRNTTNLFVKDIEQFILDGQQFSYEELFVSNEPIEVSIADLSQDEGNSGNTSFVFNLTRTGDLRNSLTAQWEILLAGEADEDDFALGQAQNGQVVFDAGSADAEVLIQVNGDRDFEPDENFDVVLSNLSAGTFDKSSASGTILNDDEPPLPELPEVSIEATDANKEEGNEGPNPFTFTVTRTGDNSGETKVSWRAAPTFTNPADASDFVADTIFSNQLTFEPGETSKVITLNVNGDLDIEEDEGFQVTLSNPINGTITQGTATGTILNDDGDTQPPEEGQTLSRSQIRGRTFEGTDQSDFYRATSGGIISSTFDTKGGRDFIIGRVSANSNVNAAIDDTQIDSGDGNDFISADAEAGRYAIDNSEINSGDGNDLIRAVNTSDRQFGINATTINAGIGDDEIIADSENFAIQDTLLNGGDGNDTFELRSALNQGENNGLNSTINGGSGDGDLLILGSSNFRYFYELGSSTERTGTISNSGGTTSLQVEGVELFQFANEAGTTYIFEELFV